MAFSGATQRFVAVAAVALTLAGCAVAETAADPAPSAQPLPPTGGIDYQLGGAYELPAGVSIVARDRTDEPAPGAYSICYVNGFQTQPGELEAWPAEAILTRDGEPVMDPDWPDEALLDTHTLPGRAAIMQVVGPWIDDCAERGFDAVEFDNLDTYTRSGGALSFYDNLALASSLVKRAHEAGLAAGQKNSPAQSRELRATAGFDFAVAESCAIYKECGLYREVYGDDFLGIEYTDFEFDAPLPVSLASLCEAPGAPSRMILRDRGLTAPGDPGYTYEVCPR